MPMIDDAFLTKKTSRLRGSNEGSTSAQRKILYRFTSLKKKNTSSKGGIGPPARPDFLSAPPPPAPPLLVVIIPRRSYEDYAPADRQLNTTSTYRSDKSQLLLNAAPRCICPGKVGGNPRKGVGGGGGPPLRLFRRAGVVFCRGARRGYVRYIHSRISRITVLADRRSDPRQV